MTMMPRAAAFLPQSGLSQQVAVVSFVGTVTCFGFLFLPPLKLAARKPASSLAYTLYLLPFTWLQASQFAAYLAAALA